MAAPFVRSAASAAAITSSIGNDSFAGTPRVKLMTLIGTQLLDVIKAARATAWQSIRNARPRRSVQPEKQIRRRYARYESTPDQTAAVAPSGSGMEYRSCTER